MIDMLLMNVQCDCDLVMLHMSGILPFQIYSTVQKSAATPRYLYILHSNSQILFKYLES